MEAEGEIISSSKPPAERRRGLCPAVRLFIGQIGLQRLSIKREQLLKEE